MPKKQELNRWLKENNYTKEQMQNFWDELIETNAVVRSLSSAGYNWDSPNINMSVVKQIPTQKERDIKAQQEKEQREKEEAERKEKLCAEKKYYQKHFNEILYDKILKHEDLTELQFRDLVYVCDEVERYNGENRRWSRTVTSIIKLLDRFFEVVWEEGLTENQEDSFSDYPKEVFPVLYGKTTKYVVKENLEEEKKKAEEYNKKQPLPAEDAEILFRIIQMKNHICPTFHACLFCPFETEDGSEKCGLKDLDMYEMIDKFKKNEEVIDARMKELDYIDAATRKE